jgi:hypothetical protein
MGIHTHRDQHHTDRREKIIRIKPVYTIAEIDLFSCSINEQRNPTEYSSLVVVCHPRGNTTIYTTNDELAGEDSGIGTD